MITIAIPHHHRHDEDSKYLKQCFELGEYQITGWEIKGE